MYTDAESKIIQYKKIENFFTVALVIELMVFVMEFMAAMRTGSIIFVIITILIGLIVFIIFHNLLKCKDKIRELEKEYTL